MSVADIVREKKEKIDRVARANQNLIDNRKKKQASKQYSAEVGYVIRMFDHNVFSINSTEEEVADFILNWKGSRNITSANDCKQTMPGYIEVDPYLYALKFYRTERPGEKYIGSSSRYNKWKKELEDKFNVKISIGRHYTYERRFGNSGYEQPSDEIFQGVRATVTLKE